MNDVNDTYTHRPGVKWVNMSQADRIDVVRGLLRADPINDGIFVEQALDNGHIIIRIEHSIPANKRGAFLLDLEQSFKDNIDMGLTLWLEPVGDKSKLRQLRGVEVKS